ncbi:ATP-binding cassette, sub-family B, member 4, partial [Neoconidiobolus thromboides FSU 785]
MDKLKAYFKPKKKDTSLSKVVEKELDPQNELSTTTQPVPFIKLFQFSTFEDKLLLLLATIASVINGLSQPILLLLCAQLIGLLGEYQKSYLENPELANTNLKQATDFLCILFVIIGIIIAIAAYLQLSLWLIVGETQALRIRNKYYYSILTQEVGWFDINSSGDIASRIASDINLIQDGISDKVGLLIQYVSCFIGAFLIAIINGWKLTLVMLSSIPLLVIAGMLTSKLIANVSKDGQEVYGEAGSIVEEVLSAIKTIYSFNTQEREQNRYEEKLKLARKTGFRKAIFSGISNGINLLVVFLSYALAMWYGGKLILNNEESATDVLIVFFNVLIGSTMLGMTSASLTAISTAQGAAAKLFEIIERKSNIDPFLVTDEHLRNQSKISSVKGNITFENVQFSYPSRPDVQILKGITFEASKGQTVALVGHSGSGKSTCVGLIERFYAPTSGRVLLDGIDISKISNKFLKEHVSLVGQEPCLFGTTIKQNILFGLKNDDEFKVDAKQLHDRVVNACKLANIHDFIMKLPQQYDTMVGDRGSQLSGGQKQRIAIARAIIKDPTILLLDEATSALDTESERIVQKALDNAAKDRTTIVIAH